MTKFVPGEEVSLNSSNHRMTVNRTNENPDGTPIVYCSWWSNKLGKYVHEQFLESSLKLRQDPNA